MLSRFQVQGRRLLNVLPSEIRAPVLAKQPDGVGAALTAVPHDFHSRPPAALLKSMQLLGPGRPLSLLLVLTARRDDKRRYIVKGRAQRLHGFGHLREMGIVDPRDQYGIDFA
ncbi:hypothetical protein D1872_216180 [compost metagenome]